MMNSSGCHLLGFPTCMLQFGNMFVSLWEFFYGHFFRFWMKWLLRQMTGKCELQRIFDTYGGAQRTYRIENSLTYSKNKVLQNATRVAQSELDRCIANIMKEKNICSEKDTSFQICMRTCLLQITGYKQLSHNLFMFSVKPVFPLVGLGGESKHEKVMCSTDVPSESHSWSVV